MELEEVEALRARWGRGRRLFRYFKDRYALMLLEYSLSEMPSIAALKRSRFSPLLQKPIVREMIARAGGADLSRRALIEAWRPETEAYRLSLGTWPLTSCDVGTRWAQVTRDRWNLVLQLNLDRRHVRRLISEHGEDEAEHPYTGVHPVAEAPELTLAWVRMDIDLERRQALIEEIQTDWIQHVACEASGHDSDDPYAAKWKRYEQELLGPHRRAWSEAVLAAAIEVLHLELQISDIYYHRYDSGAFLKNMGDSRPPRSIYTKLPKRFCFATTNESPRFVVETARSRQRRCLRRRDLSWFRLQLPDSTPRPGATSVPPWQAPTSSSTGMEPEAAAETPGRWSSK